MKKELKLTTTEQRSKKIVMDIKKIGIIALIIVALIAAIIGLVKWYNNDNASLWKAKYQELELKQSEYDTQLQKYEEDITILRDSVVIYHRLYLEADSLENEAQNNLSQIRYDYEKINAKFAGYSADEHIQLFTRQTDSVIRE